MEVTPFFDDDLDLREVRLPPGELVYLIGMVEASEGLGMVYGRGGGRVLVATPAGRGAELDELLADLCGELEARGAIASFRPVDVDEARAAFAD